jgi:ferredoxin
VKVAVDQDKCQGHARCYALVPELFSVDDYGMSSVLGEGLVPPELEDRARLAIANCPEFAISEVTTASAPRQH